MPDQRSDCPFVCIKPILQGFSGYSRPVRPSVSAQSRKPSVLHRPVRSGPNPSPYGRSLPILFGSAEVKKSIIHPSEKRSGGFTEKRLYGVRVFGNPGSKAYPGEDEELEERIPLLQNSERIIESLVTSYELLYGTESSILARMKKASDSLSRSEEFSRDIQQQKEVLEDCYYRLQDTAEELRRFQDHFTYDKDALDQAIERLEKVEQLKRKYGGSIPQVLEYQQQLQNQLALLEDASYNRNHLIQELKAAENELQSRCHSLTEDRRDAALRLKTAMEAELKELNFKDAQIDIDFQEIPPGENGADWVEFLISTNKGEATKPLAKTASGGEISRIMLAFKSILGRADAIPTLIFDEIDSGISGITASVVGKKLQHLSREHQILCITHLPQIAAFGDHHYRIFKKENEERITTTVEPLDQEGVLSEIARLTGGLSITKATLENARELMEASRKQL